MADDELSTVLAERLASVRSRIAAASTRAMRNSDEVRLVAVTKTVSPRVARLIAELGVLDLGESRPQELWRKAEELKDLPIRWHLVGHLQRNKVERTLPLVHMTHSVDSLRLFEAMSIQGIMHGLSPRVLLEVNASGEEQKHGFAFEELAELGNFLSVLQPLVVEGLMGMAAYSDDSERARPTFAALRRFRDRLRGEWSTLGEQLKHLSMGMSGDFEIAIEEGATIVRIGSTLFEGLEGE